MYLASWKHDLYLDIERKLPCWTLASSRLALSSTILSPTHHCAGSQLRVRYQRYLHVCHGWPKKADVLQINASAATLEQLVGDNDVQLVPCIINVNLISPVNIGVKARKVMPEVCQGGPVLCTDLLTLRWIRFG